MSELSQAVLASDVKYAYKLEMYDRWIDHIALTKLGNEGWEVVSVTPIRTEYGNPHHPLYMNVFHVLLKCGYRIIDSE